MVTMNTALYGFIAWVPTFFVKQGARIGSSLGFATPFVVAAAFGIETEQRPWKASADSRIGALIREMAG